MRYLLVCKYPNSPPQAKIFGDLSIGVKGVYPPGVGGVSAGIRDLSLGFKKF